MRFKRKFLVIVTHDLRQAARILDRYGARGGAFAIGMGGRPRIGGKAEKGQISIAPARSSVLMFKDGEDGVELVQYPVEWKRVAVRASYDRESGFSIAPGRSPDGVEGCLRPPHGVDLPHDRGHPRRRSPEKIQAHRPGGEVRGRGPLEVPLSLLRG